MKDLSHRLADEARAVGFAKMGICAPDASLDTAARLAAFLAEGRHGQMGWMAERVEWRGNAQSLWPEARSVIMLAEAYTPEVDPLAVLEQRDLGAISVYAQGKDYHDLVKRRLKRLGRWLLDQAGGEIKVFVDTAPVMEKPLAQAAGLGWQGKHTNLLARDLGNWVFLGAIFTTLDLPKDAPEISHCGSCTACLDICPTGAFPALPASCLLLLPLPLAAPCLHLPACLSPFISVCLHMPAESQAPKQPSPAAKWKGSAAVAEGLQSCLGW
jgi:epoxyqueuosine reductase